MKSLLNEIVNNNGAKPASKITEVKILAELPLPAIEAPAGRMSTAQLLTTLQQLGAALSNAGEAFSKMPGASPDQLPSLLEQIIQQAAGAQAKAARLLAANR